MIDHVSFSVNVFSESLAFYDNTLSVLGYERLMTFDKAEYQVAAYGKEGKPSFWIGNDLKEPRLDEAIGKARGVHIAFLAPREEAVHTWHKKCLALGGKNNGQPGPRPEYHPGYYGAFIIDPNGWRIETCIHDYKVE